MKKLELFIQCSIIMRAPFLEFVCAPVELDHTLVWLPCEKAAEQMNVEQQAWAVRKALEKLAWMKEHIE
ncbi:MAG: hypothetical protein ACLUVI_09535 [Acutalibacteraceae bacterium]